ncbi:MAG: type II toxin-antitoxin system PemK/MazF family toxin [Gammaproteobacteria bacterium]|nr:type II toxin-antitoxin system PemK/MazF family toxin [Gammaproteobacteria bacterium]
MVKNKIVLLPFPFDDFSALKVRPVVCLTDPIGQYKHVVVAFITSRILSNPLPTDIVLTPKHPHFTKTGLCVPSMIQLHRLMTIQTSLIKRELGTLPIHFRETIVSKLRQLFDL